MPNEKQHVGESASVQITPAPVPTEPAAEPALPAPVTAPNPGPDPDPESPKETPPVTPAATNPAKSLLTKITSLFGVMLLVASVACSAVGPAQSSATLGHADTSSLNESTGVYPNDVSAPTHEDGSSMAEATGLQTGVPHFSVSDDSHPAPMWRAHLDVSKCLGEVVLCTPAMAYETVSAEHNLLTTSGAAQLWNCLSGGSCATTMSTTNAQLAVGDASTAANAADTDLGAAAGTKLNAADVTSCTNATPIVCAGTYSPTPLVGQVVVNSAFSGAGAAAVNGTFELSAASASSITLLNSAGTGAITVTGGLIKPINKYRQQANAAGSAVVSTNQIVFVATFGTTNANFQWLEWGSTTGAAATNKQATPPPLLLQHAIPAGGLGTKTSAASWTLTVTLSLS